MLHSTENENFGLTKTLTTSEGFHQGTDADFDMIVQRYRDMSGNVDAFGVGGLEGCGFGTNVMDAPLDQA